MIINKKNLGLLKYLHRVIEIITIMPRREGMLAIDLNMDISLYFLAIIRIDYLFVRAGHTLFS